jgi:Protein of unknown function (DUF4197)
MRRTACLRACCRASPAAATSATIRSAPACARRSKVGTERVTASLGQVDGFNTNPDVHIPLPQSLQAAQSALAMVGMSGLADDLELRMNRAAETAVPQAKQLFWQAVSEMTLEDAQGILGGPDDASTRYFQDKMTAPLTERFTPVVDQELADAGAVQAYDQMRGDYQELPFAPDVQANSMACS